LTSLQKIRQFTDGLAFRVAALLAFALFPIGLIAISLTGKFAEEADRRAETALMAVTAEAAASEEGMIRGGFGATAAFVAALPSVRLSSVDCNAVFADFVRENPQFSFAGFVNRAGILECGSADQGRDMGNSVILKAQRANPEVRADLLREAPISKTAVIVMSEPVLSGERFEGYVAVSLPHKRIFQTLELLPTERPIDLITFNRDGQVLSSESGLENVADGLPGERSLLSFVGHARTAFTGQTAGGEERVFAVVPILANTVYAIGSWPRERLAVAPGFALSSPLIFPVVMWLASLGVAYFAVHRLVIKHIRKLRSEMQVFTKTRFLPDNGDDGFKPLEIREIDRTWHDLAETVVRDEAELEGTIRDKTVLLKEVHHRVKNNLQLISSIVNMKIRKATVPEARAALKEVQMRVMSIATAHRSLYETSSESRVRADELLKGIITSLVEGGAPKGVQLRFEQSYDPVTLYPDQAVPLSLLGSEAVTNALKYLGRPAAGCPWIEVRLSAHDGSRAVLEVSNSKGVPITPPEQVRGTGLGTSLISAFAHQLRGTVDTRDDDETYRIYAEFPIVDFEREARENALAGLV
tara:strand:+ start:3059 stop:4810 length:1752 start_codon:yes stop_codon:yes gene_type:complete